MARSRPEISIVIATFNRAELLAGALESLAEQTLDRSRYEIVVVDNGSTDETPTVVAEFQRTHPQLRTLLVPEKRRGLGRARNTGDDHAAGRLVAFLDDDARAEQDWLEKALSCFGEVNPTPLAVGGPIRPFYLAPKPDWFKDEYEIRSWGEEPRFLSRGETFSGSNMVFAKEALRDHGSFSDRFGMKGERLSVGEESALFEEIWRRNPDAPLYYSPDLVVLHAVPAHKMTGSYVLKRALAGGQAMYAIRRDTDPHSGRFRILAREALPGFVRGLAGSLRRRRLFEHGQNWVFEDLAIIFVQLGVLLACLGIKVRVKRQS
jgi:glycosyltransferase involved in cell wall biosynthesis